VSHLLNRSLHLHIGTRTVWGVLRPAWSRRKVLARARYAFGPSALDLDISITEESPEESYCDALEAVVAELDYAASVHMAQLKVVLADSRVHYDVVSGDYKSSSDRELQAIAAACVAEVLGDRSMNQVVRWQLQPDRRHLLISSIDTGDIDALTKVASRLQLRLNSLQTEFCTQWNLRSNALPNGTGVFSVVSGSHLIAVYALCGSIIGLSCGPCSHGGETPNSVTSASPIDESVDRLLTSIGRDTKDDSTFLLIASDHLPIPVTSRWNVIRPTEESV